MSDCKDTGDDECHGEEFEYVEIFQAPKQGDKGGGCRLEVVVDGNGSGRQVLLSQRDEQICYEVAEKQDVGKPRPLPCIHRTEIHYADVPEHKG